MRGTVTIYSTWHKSDGLAGRIYEDEVVMLVQLCDLSFEGGTDP